MIVGLGGKRMEHAAVICFVVSDATDNYKTEKLSQNFVFGKDFCR
jgi:hypothetical protein